ncbi:MAG: hypothetical protein PHE26_09940, partial [Syntrophomonadaceae bacterium]|nr:hypothetical protein [Syntrophomonadaceae bacterium]
VINPHHIISAGTVKAMNHRPYQAQEMSWVLRNIPAAGLPETATLALVLLVYLLLLGPGIYLLLKKYDRRDWGWLVIPLLAVLMFSFTYLGVFKAKGRDVFTNVISLLRLDQDSDYSRLTSYIGAFAPTKSNYTFSLQAGDLVNVLPGNEEMMYKRMTVSMVNNPASTQIPVLATVQQGDSPQVLYTDSSRWSMRCIVAEKSIFRNGEIVSDLHSNPGGISGTVKNNTGHTLSDCLVFNRYGYQRIARLGPGETTKIDISLRFSPSKGPAFNRIFERYPIQRPQNINNALNRDNQINRQLMEYLSYSSDLFDDPLIFLGNSADPIDAQALGQTRGEKYYNTIIVSNLKLNIDRQGQVDVPPGIINGRFAGSDGRNYYQDSWGFSVDSGSINFNLNLPFAVSELDTQELKIYIGSNDYRRAGIMKIKIYNNQLAQWEDFSYQSTGIPLPAAKQYISDESVIKVKIGAPEDKNQSNINVSNVTLSLKGRLLTTALSKANESSISRGQEASAISEGQENQNSLEEESKLEPVLGVPESVKRTGGGE